MFTKEYIMRPKKTMAEKKIQTTVHMSAHAISEVEEYRAAFGATFSGACEHLLKEGLKSMGQKFGKIEKKLIACLPIFI